MERKQYFGDVGANSGQQSEHEDKKDCSFTHAARLWRPM